MSVLRTNPHTITTVGNATLIAYDEKPILATDPWIGDEDPAYFGSWVLSHQIPNSLKEDISSSEFIWFSHAHPDHLNPISLERYKANKILLPDHVGARIFSAISKLGFQVTVLPDREWVQLSKHIRIQCITTATQDAVLLIDNCGQLFINLNDAGPRHCSGYIKSISQTYKHSYLLALAGYGDTDMINFFNEDGSFILPRAAQKPSVGKQLGNFAKLTGAKAVLPFSSFHQYQRADSIWAQKFTTPILAYREGLDEQYQYIPPFSTIDCKTLDINTNEPREFEAEVQQPEVFGDNWSDELNDQDKRNIENYFERKERIQNYFGFLNFDVGGKMFTLKLQANSKKGITFSVPRNSLMTAITYRIFDDLLIGNFMKTTLHNCESLYEGVGNFAFNVAKCADNGLAETEEEIHNYHEEYKKRAGYEFIVDSLADRAKDFLVRFASKDSKLYSLVKTAYIRCRP